MNYFLLVSSREIPTLGESALLPSVMSTNEKTIHDRFMVATKVFALIPNATQPFLRFSPLMSITNPLRIIQSVGILHHITKYSPPSNTVCSIQKGSLSTHDGFIMGST